MSAQDFLNARKLIPLVFFSGANVLLKMQNKVSIFQSFQSLLAEYSVVNKVFIVERTITLHQHFSRFPLT